MSDLKATFDSMLSVAKAAAAVIVPGVPEAIALGERVIEMIDHAKDAFGAGLPPELPAAREEIEARVREHVASSAARLRGG